MINKKEFGKGLSQSFYFKGQKAECRGWGFKVPFNSFYDIGIDFYGFDASECLNVNRDYWLKEFIEEFNNKILEEILEDIIQKRNGFENVFSEFYNLVLLIKNNQLDIIEKIEFNTNLGYLKLEQIKNYELIYANKIFYENHDALPKVFNPNIIIEISDLKILDFFIESMEGFFCHKVEGLKFLGSRGDISLLFSKREITMEHEKVKVYKINSIEKSLEYFLESKIVHISEQRRAGDIYEDFKFPIIVSKKLFPESFALFFFQEKIILPLYFTVKEIHFIKYSEYLRLIPDILKSLINVNQYENLVNFLKIEISRISNIKITDHEKTPQ
ncbi:hypothetical protein HLH11_05785 [Acinetobacter sp. ANC 4280]|uniref:Uncharacterized protein n=1 Tax=Acinetobacter terrae TaxID=2731247 RepID=A0A8E4F7F7_9GAMM|nr:hypothetical protein [Acinetobacter terrae]NNH38170.1 hypothetical protein [Acinetobacter terrae]